MGAIGRFLRWCGGFLEDGPKQSSARLLAVVAVIGLAAVVTESCIIIWQVMHGPSGVAALFQLAVLLGSTIGVTLALRSEWWKRKPEPQDPPPDPPIPPPPMPPGGSPPGT
jgi:hypothetical protein